MKLVGDSKFIAEAYQSIHEDDFMSGVDEYENKINARKLQQILTAVILKLDAGAFTDKKADNISDAQQIADIIINDNVISKSIIEKVVKQGGWVSNRHDVSDGDQKVPDINQILHPNLPPNYRILGHRDD